MSQARVTQTNGTDPSARIGYTRISPVSQTLDQQNAALKAAGTTKTFSDIMSGARDDRPGLAALMEYVREGDTMAVWKLDRLDELMDRVDPADMTTQEVLALVAVFESTDQ
jgi:DNA invertase Pin-like site-specific DNA recombinase